MTSMEDTIKKQAEVLNIARKIIQEHFDDKILPWGQSKDSSDFILKVNDYFEAQKKIKNEKLFCGERIVNLILDNGNSLFVNVFQKTLCKNGRLFDLHPQNTNYPLSTEYPLKEPYSNIEKWTHDEIREYINYLITFNKGEYKELTYIKIGEDATENSFDWTD